VVSFELIKRVKAIPQPQLATPNIYKEPLAIKIIIFSFSS